MKYFRKINLKSLANVADSPTKIVANNDSLGPPADNKTNARKINRKQPTVMSINKQQIATRVKSITGKLMGREQSCLCHFLSIGIFFSLISPSGHSTSTIDCLAESIQPPTGLHVCLNFQLSKCVIMQI